MRSRLSLFGAIALVVVAGVFIAWTFVARGPAAQVVNNTLISGAGANAIVQASDSPAIVRNPTNAQNVVIVDRIDRPGYSAAVHWTMDAGQSWRTTSLPLPPGRDRPYGPDAVFGSNGTLYVTYVNLEGTGNDPQELWLARSTDGGATFSGPYPITGRYAFQARLAVDRSGTVYVTYLHATQVGLLTIPGTANVVMQRSTDGGLTFAAPVPVSDASRIHVGAATPVVDSNGTVDVLYEDFKADARDFLNLPGPAWESPFALVLTRSTDHGQSFARGQAVDSNLMPSGRFLVYLPQFPSIAPGPGGTLYVAWADARSGADRVYLRRSTDRGQTWQALVNVTPGVSGTDVSAWLPAVSVAPNGRVDVVYYQGHRDTGDKLIGAYVATSADGTGGFTATQASSQLFNSSIGPMTGPSYLPPDLGSRLGIVSDNSGAMAVWTDTRQGTTDTGRQDIGQGTLAIGPAPIGAWRWIVFAALLIAAELLATAWLIGERRRRAEAAARAARTTLPIAPG
jgi:hypothetical protein